ncbi:MAG: hypothetical protein ACFE8L_04490 [Candidatus Hodarchaeota archaeon]
MKFTIPRNNSTELLLYIWKIIDVPYISQNDLLYKLSFDLFLFPPEEVINFINGCTKNKSLIRDANNNLKLSNELHQKLINWQNKRKQEILEKMHSIQKIVTIEKQTENGNATNFNAIIKTFIDKGTLNRAASISNNAYDLLEFNPSKGIIKANVLGSKEEPYIIEIDINNKIIRHNCHDFETRRAENKKFCKHLAKLFLLLKEKDSKNIEIFLNNIAADIDKWEFRSTS